MTIKYKGVRIVPVKVTKYEVRDPTGRKMHSAPTPAAARQWVNGYLTASAQALRQVAEAPPTPATPKRRRVAKDVQTV